MCVSLKAQLLVAILCGFLFGEIVASDIIEKSKCRRHRIVHTIKSANCVPRRLLSYACQGTCHSYTQLAEDSGNFAFKRNCNCCQEMGQRTAVVRALCRDMRSKKLKMYAMRIKVPKECMCRPCSEAVNVKPLELHMTEIKEG